MNLFLEAHAKARAPYIRIVNPTDVVCPGGVCAAKTGGKALQTDYDPYSSIGNEILGRYVLDHLR